MLLLSVPHLYGLGSLYFLVQLEYPIEQSLGCGRTSWHKNINWYNAITASNNGIRVVIIASAISATEEEEGVISTKDSHSSLSLTFPLR